MNTKKTFHVQFSTFSGAFGGRGHIYVTVREFLADGSVESHELTREITASEARQLNKEDDWDGWREGMETPRFDSEADARARAEEWLSINASESDEVFWGLDFYK